MTDSSRPVPERRPVLRRLRPAFILAALVAAYALAGFQIVPRVITAVLKDAVRADYGRELAIGAVRFNPFTLTLRVEQLALPDADGGPLLAFGSLFLDLESASLWRRAWSLSALVLEGLELHPVIRPGGALNLLDFVPPADPATAGEPLPRLRIHDLRITGGRIRVEDRNQPETRVAELSPLEFHLADFTTYAASGDRYELDATLFGQSRLTWRGTLRAQPLASEGEFSLTDLPLPRLVAWLGAALPAELREGTAGVRGRYRFGLAGSEADLRIEDGELAIRDLAVRIPGEEADALVIGEVAATGMRLALDGQQVDIAGVTVTGGRLAAWLTPAGEINLLALAGPAATDAPQGAVPDPAAAGEPAGEAPAGAAWVVNIPSISLRQFALQLEDRSIEPAPALLLEPLNVTAQGFTTAPGARVALSLDTGVNGRASLSASGTVDLDTQNVEAAFELQDLDLRFLQPYLARATSLTLTAGALSTSGRLNVAGDGAALAFEGDATINGLRTVDNALGEDFVKWSALRLQGLRYRSSPASLGIAAVDARDPYARLIIGPDGTTNLAAVLAGPGAVAAPAAGPTLEASRAPGEAAATVLTPGTGVQEAAGTARTGSAFPVRLGTVSIRGGSGNFADFTTRPNFAIAIEELSGTIKGLSSDPASRARVELDGRVDRFSPVTIRGDINPLAAETFADMQVTLSNVELASFTPYAGRFAGYTIRQGKLSAELNYKVNNRQLDADHHFVLNQLELGDKVESPDAVGLPLKLAIALLKDRNGVIDLALPVTGNLDDPQFRIGPIVWKVFVNLLTKAVTAPFALLGNLFGGGEELNLIDFAPGSAGLEAPDEEKLASLVQALADRPGLQLSIPAAFSRELDAPVLTEQALQRAVLLAREAEQQARRRPEPVVSFEALAADREDYFRELQGAWRRAAGADVPLPEPPPAAADGPKLSREELLEARIGALEEGLRQRIAVGDSELFQLARARGEAVRDRLLTDTGIDPARVFLTAPVPARLTATAVVMELALE